MKRWKQRAAGLAIVTIIAALALPAWAQDKATTKPAPHTTTKPAPKETPRTQPAAEDDSWLADEYEDYFGLEILKNRVYESTGWLKLGGDFRARWIYDENLMLSRKTRAPASREPGRKHQA